LLFEGGTRLLQRAVGNEAMRRCPHENATAGGDVGPVEADGQTVLCLWPPSLLLWEAGVYCHADVRDDLDWVCGTRCGRDAGWGEWGWVKTGTLWQAR
jgi:hypothetical protein